MRRAPDLPSAWSLLSSNHCGHTTSHVVHVVDRWVHADVAIAMVQHLHVSQQRDVAACYCYAGVAATALRAASRLRTRPRSRACAAPAAEPAPRARR